MQLPEAVKAIRTRYVAQFPIPQGQPGEAHEERCRQWSIAFAEQVAFEQGALWGMKRADNGRPISKDTITLYGDDYLTIWDLLTGTGTGNPRLVDDPQGEPITGQVFVRVTPTNHLAVSAPERPAPTLPPADLGPVMVLLEKLAAQQGDIAAAVGRLEGGYQAQVENFATLGGKLDGISAQTATVAEQLAAVAAKAGHIPDAEFRLGGRVVGKVDFPD